MSAPDKERRDARAKFADAMRDAAFATDDGRALVHSFASAPGIMIGADHDLEDALKRLAEADEVVWRLHPLRHDLGVRVGDRVYWYDVRSPERQGDL